jgi:hypothetical protein
MTINSKAVATSILVLLLYITGCSAAKSTSAIGPTPTPEPETQTYSKSTLDTVALAFISYAGDNLDNTDAKVEEKLESCLYWELARQPQVANQYKLAWGPAVYRFDYAWLDDNMMYAVRENADPSHLIIAIRGTNPDSISDWFVEDFLVKDTEAWNVGSNVPAGARISQATSIGVHALSNDLKDRTTGKTIIDFLSDSVSAGNVNKITITGHSLAGALAPTFALYLSDTRTTWDKNQNTPINVVAIAGATPGNAVFANYYDNQLGSSTLRLHNHFDVVPHAWDINDMDKLDGLYSSQKIEPSLIEKGAFSLGKWLAKDRDYQQILKSAAATPKPYIANLIGIEDAGKTITKNDYANQAGFQHHCGYYQALGINKTMVQTNSNCLTLSQCVAWKAIDYKKYQQYCAPLYAPVPLCQAPHLEQ